MRSVERRRDECVDSSENTGSVDCGSVRSDARALCARRDRSDLLEQPESDPAAIQEFPDDLDYEHLAVRKYSLCTARHNRIRLERGGHGA